MTYQKGLLKLMLENMTYSYENACYDIDNKPAYNNYENPIKNAYFNQSAAIVCLTYMVKLKGKDAILFIESGELKYFTDKFFTNKDSIELLSSAACYNLILQLDKYIIKEISENLFPNWFINSLAITKTSIIKSLFTVENNIRKTRKQGDSKYYYINNIIEKCRIYEIFFNKDIIFELDKTSKKKYMQHALKD